MGTTPKLGLPYPEITDPADVPADMKELALAVDNAGTAFVTSLPASPTDGQEVIYAADAALGVLWRLRYRAAAPAPYRWEFVGGTDLLHEIVTTEATTTADGVYRDVATPGPLLTLPLAGDYLITADATIYTTAATPFTGIGGLKIGAAVVNDVTDRICYVGDTGAAGGVGGTSGRTLRRTITPAAVIKLQYASYGAAVQVASRVLRARPVRVG